MTVTNVPLPTGLTYGRVTGRFADMVGDTPADVDADPEMTPISGLQITFVAAPSRLLDAFDKITFLPQPVKCTTNSDGVLIDSSGNVGVSLVATDQPSSVLNPTDFTYTVTITRAGAVLNQFPIKVPSGSVQDLTTLAPVPSSAGNAVTLGPQGPQGPIGPVGNVPNGTVDGTAMVWDAANSAWTASQRPVGGLVAYAENATGVVTVVNSTAKQGPQGLTVSVPPTPGDVWISFRALITTTTASVAGQFASYILNQSSVVMWTGYSSVLASEPAGTLHTMTGEVRIGPLATTQTYALAFGTAGGTLAGNVYNGNKTQGLHSWIRAVAL